MAKADGGALAALLALLLACLLPAAARAQAVEPSVPDATATETQAQAIDRDGADYARQFGVSAAEGARRLRLQEASVPATDALAQRYRDRLAGIAVEHGATFRIVVSLTGTQPVADQHVNLGGDDVPIVFHTGAKATRDRVIWAMTNHQAEIRALLRSPPGMGLDPRTGELVLILGSSAAAAGVDTIRDQVEAMTGVPVQVRVLDRVDVNLSPEGGSRVEGLNPADGRRYVCTTAFTVTDGTRSGVLTAAHCLDALDYVGPQRLIEPLAFLAQWGWGYRDVQINLAPELLAPLFFADTARTITRAVTGQRTRASMRAGDFVCHRGERTGYSCAVVELTDFAPAGDLCGGPCLPTWVTVQGPNCRGGDSGSPVFIGTTALGVVKGGSYRRDGSCAFYFYMSLDYLPPGWSLLTAPATPIY